MLTDTSVDQRTVERYASLIRVSEALGIHHDRDRLFRALAHELRHVVTFSYLGLGLYDEKTHTVERRVLQATGAAVPLPEIPTEESLTYWIVQHQQALIIPRVDDEYRFPRAMAYFRTHDIVSICVLPLTTPVRPLGVLVAGSREPSAYGADEVEFLSLVANQVALAIDNAQNFGALQAALAAERERADNLSASDEMLRALSSVLDIRQVFPRISEIAAKVLPHDRMTMTFHEAGEAIVEAASDQAGAPNRRLKFGHGFCVTDNEFLILDDFEKETFDVVEPRDFWDRTRAAGYRSVLIVRLRARDQQVGLQFWSKQPGAFQPRDVPIAQRIADHVALAVSHEQLSEAARQVAEAGARAARLEARVKSLSDELEARAGHGQVVGPSEEWNAVLKAAAQVASTDTTVLLTGESGTGKEVVARFVHRASARKTGPFVALNCAALPEQLLESELFGYERGAFTGAQQAKPGHLELAAGGVLFLDEVSEMSSPAQAKFLRVLQEREFQRLGGTRVLKANVRVIAATNRDLQKAMARGDFREDLFYRLQVFEIKLPPLRVRIGDILPLAEAFLHEIGQLFGRPPAGLTHDAKIALLEYHWPGNVRELHNALERAAILCEGGLITAEHLGLEAVEQARPPSGTDATGTTDLKIVERDTIAQVLNDCVGNKSKAAKRLGLSRTQLYVRLRKYGLG